MHLKKSGSSLGGKRGRLIPASERTTAVLLIKEAKDAGARIFKACEVLDISVRTLKRWKSGNTQDIRKGAVKSVPIKLSEKERQAIIDVCCQKEYQDLTPYEIQVMLLDAKFYLGSVSTFYRILRERDLVHFHGNTRKGTTLHRPPERIATGPNQVWAWDIRNLLIHVYDNRYLEKKDCQLACRYFRKLSNIRAVIPTCHETK